MLALRQVEGLGHQRLRRLLAHFGTVQAVLKAFDRGCAIGKCGASRRSGPVEFDWAEVQWKRLSAEGGRCLVPCDAPIYGPLSREPWHIDELAQDSTLPPAGPVGLVAQVGVGRLS